MPSKSFDHRAIKTISHNLLSLNEFFRGRICRTYMLAVEYFPEELTLLGNTHLIAVRYSCAKQSFVLYGVDDEDTYEPWIVNEHEAAIREEFLRFRSLQVVYWSEF